MPSAVDRFARVRPVHRLTGLRVERAAAHRICPAPGFSAFQSGRARAMEVAQ